MLYDKKWDKEVEAPVTLEPWQQALLDAANIIRKRGWCQGHESYHGRVCLLGALAVAVGNKPSNWHHPTHYLARRQLELHCFTIQWNDSPGRKKAEVINALESTAGVSGIGGAP